MCVNLKTFVVNGQQRTAVCNRCWSCRLVRANDQLGRSIAEAMVCGPERVRVVCLTYADDPSVTAKFNEAIPEGGRSKRKAVVSESFAAASIVKSHFQDYIKALRKSGIRHKKNKETGEVEEIVRWTVRYTACSEFTPTSGRVHFHALLYFYGPEMPDMPIDKKLWGGDKYWPHGLLYYQSFTVKRAYYICKYQLKSQIVDNKLLKNQRVTPRQYQMQQWTTRSDQPPLGIEWFRRRAAEIAKQALSLRELKYSFPDVPRTKGGGLQEFRLRFGSATAEAYIQAYLDAWELHHPHVPVPQTELVERYQDRHAMASVILKSGMPERVAEPHMQPDGSLRQPGDPLRASFDEKLHTWVGLVHGHRRLWSFDIDGNRGWSAHIVSPTEARKRRALAAGADDGSAYRAASQPASARAKR